MDNSVIKLMLQSSKPRVYSLIVQMYFDKIELHKASIFKIWLAKELDISPELIHESSISAALARYKKKLAMVPRQYIPGKPVQKHSDNQDFDTDIPEVFPGFK